MSSDLPNSARRIADDDIYLNEDRRTAPKETFVAIADILESRFAGSGKTCLDVGCATGDLLYYLKSRFPSLGLHGIDVSQRMIDLARQRLPEVSFHNEDISIVNESDVRSYDFCVMSGLLNCFDDVEPVLDKLLTWTKPGGSFVVIDLINEDPIDVIMRHRRSSVDKPGDWEIGWNYASKATITRILAKKSGLIDKVSFVPFQMSSELARRSDPMRTWTISTQDNPRQLVNGAMQLVNQQFLVVDRRAL